LGAAIVTGSAGHAAAAEPEKPAWSHSLVVRAPSGNQQFLVDGKPFFLWGASFFYERIPREDWRASLDRIHSLGFNTIDLYVPWNWHEIGDGTFDFDGRTNPRRDLRGLLALIRSSDFKIVLRPGPVIRNEWRNGGYPAWLLARPEYDMAQHELLEGRYPPTATMQNARSDDAAAEWMSNPTHMKYAARWLQTVLREFEPVADRVIAIQLDDDQAAYIDNQTYPAPHLHAYLEWLRDAVRAASGRSVPVYINTYQPKVPGSLPVWEWGNWYQGGAYQIGEHDLADLTFSTLLLGTQRYGPVMQSEFQAGWLAAPEDQQPRPSSPSSTSLALYTLLALGVKGVIDFPPQDTMAPAGWEAPFTNWFYAWDAALTYEPNAGAGGGHSPRFAPTADFGAVLRDYGPQLATAHRVADGAIVYAASELEGPALDERLGTIVNAVQKALADCSSRGLTCDLVDPRYASGSDLIAYPFLVVPNAGAAPNAATMRTYGAAHPGKIFSAVPAVAPRSGARGITLLNAGEGAAFLIAINAGAKPRAFAAMHVPGHDRNPVPAFTLGPYGAAFIALENGKPAVIHAAPADAGSQTSRPPTTIGENLWLPDAGASPPPGAAVAYESDILRDGYPALILQNDLVRIAVDPAAGGRSFLFEDRATHTSVFNMTGALRDDVARQMTISKRDYIAAYTHSFPAGSFNRPYTGVILESGTRAVVRVSGEMPDALPHGVRFEKTLTLNPGAREFSMTERVTFPGDDPEHPQHGVSAASLTPGGGAPGDWTTMTAHTGFGVWDPKSGGLATVTWSPEQLEGEELKPYRMSIVLFMRYAPNTAPTTTYGYYREMSESAARARFAEITGLLQPKV
jgi:hypothetical protein